MEEKAYRELRLLAEVQRNPQTTQRDLARQVGIALGVTNLLLRRLVQKGYVRVTKAGWRRWLYALTPEGAARKVHLTMAYVGRFLEQYQHVRHLLQEELEPRLTTRRGRVALYGDGEIAELVYLVLRQMDVQEMDVFAGHSHRWRLLDRDVQPVNRLAPGRYEHIVVAALDDQARVCAALRDQGVDPDQVVVLFAESQSAHAAMGDVEHGG